jgi:enoyl-CoA hydratase/carnithine racemase
MECRKPVISAVDGLALGAGLAVAAFCDILVAGVSALARGGDPARGGYRFEQKREPAFKGR